MIGQGFRNPFHRAIRSSMFKDNAIFRPCFSRHLKATRLGSQQVGSSEEDLRNCLSAAHKCGSKSRFIFFPGSFCDFVFYSAASFLQRSAHCYPGPVVISTTRHHGEDHEGYWYPFDGRLTLVFGHWESPPQLVLPHNLGVGTTASTLTPT